jgi:cytochrome c oxidase subunit 1
VADAANPADWRAARRARTADGVLLPEFFLQLGAMHGTTMVFLAVVPLAVGAFGNYLIPLMVGAPDMAFPRLNALSYWLYLVAGIVMMAGSLPGGAASRAGRHPPLAVIATTVRPRGSRACSCSSRRCSIR